MTKLYLHSSQAKNNRFKLDQPIKGKYKLIGFTFTNNIFNVNDTNNKIYMRELASDLTATLTNGYYDPTEFVNMVNTELNNVCTGTISVSKDNNTNKLTISNDNFSFYFTFGTNTSNSGRKLLGFNENDGTNSTSQTSDNPIDLNSYKNIFVNISENDDRDIEGMNYFITSLIINGNGTFGDAIRYIPRDNFEQYIKFSRGVKNIEIKFHDLNNNDINLNSEYEILFQKMN